MKRKDPVREGLVRFSEGVTSKSTAVTGGAPEDQLRAPLEQFLEHLGAAWGWRVTCTGEVPVARRLGRPDYAISRDGLLTGHVELKKPGTGAAAARFRGHDKEQFKRFSNLPNVLYTDGNEWALYRDGKRVRGVVRLAGAVDVDGQGAVGLRDGERLEATLRDFLEWRPVLPLTAGGAVDLKGFGEVLAPLCRLLRSEVAEALTRPESPIHAAARDWRHLLFPEASDEQFADAYAQTVAFALLLGRSLGAEPLSLPGAEAALDAGHNLMARALRFLTDSQVRDEIGAALELLVRVIGVVPPGTLGGANDPWLHFYEDFLGAYDPKLKKQAGVYYTPVEVVRAQVRLVDDLLMNQLGLGLGFASSDVVTLDPAAGTGTYLLSVIRHALDRVKVEQGPGAVAGQASSLARRLHGFELMVGPYAVAELRTSRALRSLGGDLPNEGTGVYLADTLDSPDAEPAQLGLLLQPIADQRRRAVEVKKNVPVLVCIGNPPYHRHAAVDSSRRERLAAVGGWVRFGDPLPETEEFKALSPEARLQRRQQDSLLAAFTGPVSAAGHGGDLKNLYNSYVYFWRWALWKVFEQQAAPGPGIVSFITASSYLFGDAFVGVREHMRRVCDEIWILDLGGEGRGTRKEDNVFAIQTPVAIAVLFRSRRRAKAPARVRYARIRGTRAEKLGTLEDLKGFSSVSWQDCPDRWQAPFLPAGEGRYFEWPLLTDLLPWQHSGVEVQRTWPVAPDGDTLRRRWRGLLAAPDRAKAYREARDRKVAGVYSNEWLTGDKDKTSIAKLPVDAPLPRVGRYAYRSFDRHYLIADNRLVSYLRPELWRSHGPRQIYFLSLLSHPLDFGPALTACSAVPDRHFFRGSYGGKDVLPLYRSPDGAETNLLPGLLDFMQERFGEAVSPEEFAAYLYGVLAHPFFVQRFFDELGTCEIRVPIATDVLLFRQLSARGRELLRLHTYAERLGPEDGPSRIDGQARCVEAVTGTLDGYPESYAYNEETKTLRVGDGAFAPVSPAVFGFEVSGLKVVQSWLDYRMKGGAGKRSSPLDDIRPERWTDQFTTELLELLHVLEATLESYPEQRRLLGEVLAGDCIQARDLPPVPDEMRQGPKATDSASPQKDLYSGDG